MDTTEPAHLDGADGPLLAAPARDGRTGYADLAAATGWSESRRSGGAWSIGAVYFDVVVEPGPVGYPVRVMLCLSVAPAIVIAVNGEPVARLTALPVSHRRWLRGAELVAKLRTAQADQGLREDLARLAGDATDDQRPRLPPQPRWPASLGWLCLGGT